MSNKRDPKDSAHIQIYQYLLEKGYSHTRADIVADKVLNIWEWAIEIKDYDWFNEKLADEILGIIKEIREDYD